jgi:hydrogenase expression/formation protein HypC
MCVGVPMQVCGPEAFGFAPCRRRAAGSPPEMVDLRLVADAAEGTWLLVFNGAARHALDPLEAQRVDAALEALQLVLDGEAGGDIDKARIDALFGDLADRTPQLPAHLRT